ncbi:DUF397 domain-containing protein [Actinomadura sp. DC4]|uniref:DUF397 domain-containing protein n=1 Tax=Actinomadura sp. DC4 TaxID=3055069 RepID=UPI0025B1B795|nr:DUF397 domain-containing protein [Actinomadura sp. DC4]MDN3359525.1 DUF397 domain-containing protein [Actinomadura sp. DC4]
MNSVDSWRKSSHSGGSTGDCVEVTPVWRKASRSGGQTGDCVELALVTSEFAGQGMR